MGTEINLNKCWPGSGFNSGGLPGLGGGTQHHLPRGKPELRSHKILGWESNPRLSVRG